MQQQDLKAIGARVKSIRKLEIGGQPEMSKEAGLHVNTISKVENGHIKPPQEILTLFSEKYGYNSDWILTGKGTSRRQKGNKETPINLHAKVHKLELELNEIKKVMQSILLKLDSDNSANS